MPPSSSQKLTLVYSPWKQLLSLLVLLAMWGLAWVGLWSNFFLLEIACVLVAAYVTWHVIEILGTRSVTLYPDKIVKNGYFSQTILPVYALVLDTRDEAQTNCFFHGSKKNIRESIKLSNWYLSVELKLWLDSYLRKVYRLGTIQRKQTSPNSAANIEFERAVAAIRTLEFLTAGYLLSYVIFATYLSWHYSVFNGYALMLPEWPIRALFIGMALAVHPALRYFAKPLSAEHSTYTTKVQRAQRRIFQTALVANGLAWLGLPLFLLFGNKLDFYLLLLIGMAYHYDFYPRLSEWEKLLGIDTPGNQGVIASIPRRSLQVSLALLGGLSLATYAGNPNDFRIQQRDCQDQNGNPVACQNSGGHGGSSSGSSYRGNNSADNHSPVRRGGFGFFGGSHGFSGG